MTWQSRAVRVDREKIWIGNPETFVVLDSIPLEEIGRVATKSSSAAKKNTLGNGPPVRKSQESFSRTSSATDVAFTFQLSASWVPPVSATESEGEFLHDDDDDDDGNVFAVYPISGGQNAGKPTVFKVYSKNAAEECKTWADTLGTEVKAQLERLERQVCIAKEPYKQPYYLRKRPTDTGIPQRREQEPGILNLYQVFETEPFFGEIFFETEPLPGV